MSDARGSAGGSGSGAPSRRTIVAIVIVVLVAVLLVQNRDDVTVQLLVVDITGPQWLVGLVMFALGAATALLVRGRRAKRG